MQSQLQRFMNSILLTGAGRDVVAVGYDWRHRDTRLQQLRSSRVQQLCSIYSVAASGPLLNHTLRERNVDAFPP